MLALTRKKDEAIVVNGNIKIQVLDIGDGKVKLGIDAPKDVTIHREEIYIEIEKSNKNSVINKEMMQQFAKLLK